MATPAHPNPLGYSQALIQLVAAAVVSRPFRTLLLSNAPAALSTGYAGQSFPLAPEEATLLLAIRASSLQDLTTQLMAGTRCRRSYPSVPGTTESAAQMPFASHDLALADEPRRTSPLARDVMAAIPNA